MAGMTDSLRILITANGAQAEREFAKVGAASRRSLGQAETSAQQYSRVMTSAGIAMTTFGVVALAGLAKAAQAAEQERGALLRLENSIENMPELAGASTDAFLEQASALQQVTRYGDDVTVSAQAMLATFHLTEQQILELTPVVQDYASKFGVDLVEASKQVGKAVAGNRGVLQRNGIVIDENAYAADRFSATLEALRENAGGFAEEEGATLTGQIARLKNNVGDLVEGVGYGAVDAFSGFADAAGAASNAMKSLNPETQAAIGKFLTFGAIGLTVGGAFTFIGGQALKLRAAFIALADTTTVLRLRLLALEAAQISAAAAAGTGSASWLALGSVYAGTALVAAGASSVIAEATAEAADEWGKLTGLFRVEVDANPFGGFGEGIQAAGRGLGEVVGASYTAADGLHGVGDAAGTAASDVDELTRALDEYLAAQYDVPAAQRGLRSSFDELFASFASGTASADDMAEGLENIVGSTSDLVAAQAEHGASADEMIATVDLTRDRLLRARGAGIITAEEFRNYNEDLKGILPVVATEFGTPGLVESQSRTITYKGHVYTVPHNWATTFQANTGSAINSVQALIDKIQQLNATSTGSIASRIGQITAGLRAAESTAPAIFSPTTTARDRVGTITTIGPAGRSGPSSRAPGGANSGDLAVADVILDGEKVGEVVAARNRKYNLARGAA